MEKTQNIIQRLMIAMVVCYQRFISPFFTSRCRFHPTCSSYALQALQQFGLFTSLRLILMRLVRCHPFAKGGDDPLPARDH